MSKSIIREKRIQKAGSPYFNLECGVIAALGVVAYSCEDVDARARKYYPLDSIEMTNLSTENMTLQLDDGDAFIVPGGTIKAIEDKPYRRFRITNRDAVNATEAGEILIQMKRLPITRDTWIRKFKLRG